MDLLVKEANFASKCDLETCDGLGYMMLRGGGDGKLKGEQHHSDMHGERIYSN